MTRSTSATPRAGPLKASDCRQVHQYDKILRENMEAALPGLIRTLLGIHAVHAEELPDDVQHTKERNPDVLKKVIDKNGETFVLHVEFQVTDEREMVFRMAEYFIMLYRRYKLPVRQYVIYLGEGAPRMADAIQSEQMLFKYQLIVFSTIDYRLLLSADNPEEKMLAILANFGDSDPRQAVQTIVKEVIATSNGDFSKRRHIRHLRILANLRNFKPENLVIMGIGTLPEYVIRGIQRTIESDECFLIGQKDGMEKGIEKGEKKKTLEVVKALLLNTNHTISEIASLVKVSEAFVRRVKKSLQA